MEIENRKNIINLIVGLLLFGVSLYLIYYLTTIVDFNTTTVIINNDKNLWKFLSFIPLLISMFAGAVSIVNAIFNLKVLNIFSTILCIGLVIFFKYDLYGFATIIPAYEKAIGYLVILLIVAAILLVLDIIIQLVKNGPARRREVNLESE